MRSDGCSDTHIQRKHKERERQKRTWRRWWWCCPVLGGWGPILGWPRVRRRWRHVAKTRWVHSWNTEGGQKRKRWSCKVKGGYRLSAISYAAKIQKTRVIKTDSGKMQQYLCLKDFYLCVIRTFSKKAYIQKQICALHTHAHAGKHNLKAKN